MENNEQSFYNEYEPLKWPPDIKLTQLHLKCSCPGKDSPSGVQCPCCGRFEKMQITNWLSRDITKDFKNYGGGISAYFEMMKYCGLSLIVLAIIVVFFHICTLQTACNSGIVECSTFLKIFKFLPSSQIYSVLQEMGSHTMAEVFFWLQFSTFLYLIVVTIGMKWFLQYVNTKKVVKEDKIYSQYSLVLKQIPLYYQIHDVKKEILQIAPDTEICELFFVHQIAQLERNYKILLDLHFQIQFTKNNIKEQRGQISKDLQKLRQKYIKLYQSVERDRKKLFLNNGRAVIVFNKISDRENIYKRLKISDCKKMVYQGRKLLGMSNRKLPFYADQIAEPQQILWNYIGEASAQKSRVRLKTMAIGLGFVIVCFVVLYFPILYAERAKITNKDGFGAWLNIFIASIIQMLSIVYRLIILRLIPSRQPGSRHSESYFIVMTTVIFHFFFYLVAPACYFIFATDISNSAKLVQFFTAVVMFLISSIVLSLVDVRYRIFNARRKKTMSSWKFWGKLCQIRLHEQIRFPSFPIESKLMVLLKIWAFNAFYIFQIPYLLFLFVVALTAIYWIGKKNIYQHYKMQVYLSIELEQAVLRDYIYMFLLCVCCGYAIAAIYVWQYVFIAIIFFLSVLVNLMLTSQAKLASNDQLNSMPRVTRTLTLGEVIKNRSSNTKKSLLSSIRETELKENLFILDENQSTASLGSIACLPGYRDIYDSYLMQFKNRHFHRKLEETYFIFQDSEYERIRTSHLKRSKRSSNANRRPTEMGSLRVSSDQNNSFLFSKDDAKLTYLDEKQCWIEK